MSLSVNNFSNNLRSGARLGLFLPCKLEDFRFSVNQFIVLVILDILLEIASDYVLLLPNPEFNRYAFPIYTFQLACLLFTAYLIAKLLRKDFAILQIGVIVYSFGPLSILVQLALTYPYPQLPQNYYLWLSYLLSVYITAVVYRILYLVVP
jgi:hypothetical protein